MPNTEADDEGRYERSMADAGDDRIADETGRGWREARCPCPACRERRAEA